MNRFQKFMVAIMVVCGLIFITFAWRSEASWGQLAFAGLVLAGILLIPSSFTPRASASSIGETKDFVAELDESLRSQLQDLTSEGRKIEAIKELRAARGLGLREAKEVVEWIADEATT